MQTIKINDTRPTGWMCPACGKAHGPHVDTCTKPTPEEQLAKLGGGVMAAPPGIPLVVGGGVKD
jgi:hypothetical protein